MKRLIPVLAIALILVLCSWDDAESKRYPELRLETVQWDHPWGGEQKNNEDNPPFMDATPAPETDFGFFDIVKLWYNNINPVRLHRFYNNVGGKNTTTTIEIKPEPQTNDDSNQVTTQKGSGQ